MRTPTLVPTSLCTPLPKTFTTFTPPASAPRHMKPSLKQLTAHRRAGPWIQPRLHALAATLMVLGLGGVSLVGHAQSVGATPAAASAPRPEPATLGSDLLHYGDKLLRGAGTVAGQAISPPILGDSQRLERQQQWPGQGQAVNLLSVWETALVNDRSYRASRAANLAASERLPQARSQLLPQAQISASRGSNEVTRTGLNTLQQSQTLFDRYASGNETLSVRQAIIRPQQWYLVAQAAYQVQDAQAVVVRERQNLAIRVAASYFEALLAQDTLWLNDAQRDFLLAQLDAANKSLTAGAGTRTDIDDARAKLDLNKAQELEARQYMELTQRQLEVLVGQPVLAVAGVQPQRVPDVLTNLQPLEQWVRTAEQFSPEVRSVQAQLDAARMEVAKARAGHLPTLDLVASSQRSRSENAISPQAQYAANTLALQLNVPLYSGGAVNSLTRQASADVERLTELREAVKLDLGTRIHKEYRGVTEGMARVRALEQALESAGVALESAQKSFAAGVRTRLDVLNAQAQRMQVMRDLFQARYNALVSTVRLEALAGRVDDGVMPRVNAVLQVLTSAEDGRRLKP